MFLLIPLILVLFLVLLTIILSGDEEQIFQKHHVNKFMNFNLSHSAIHNHTNQYSYFSKHIGIIVTSTVRSEIDHSIYLRSRVIPSARTWMKSFRHVFVILEDTSNIRFSLRHCKRTEHTHKYTSFSCPHEPIYVLSRVCSPLLPVETEKSKYFSTWNGQSCKIEDAINVRVKKVKEVYGEYTNSCEKEVTINLNIPDNTKVKLNININLELNSI